MSLDNPLNKEGISEFFKSKKMCLNEAHANMLECLRHYGTLSQKELGRKLAADYQITKRLIISLLNYEFISGSQNPADKWNNLIELSETGEALLYCLYEKLYGEGRYCNDNIIELIIFMCCYQFGKKSNVLSMSLS